MAETSPASPPPLPTLNPEAAEFKPLNLQPVFTDQGPISINTPQGVYPAVIPEVLVPSRISMASQSYEPSHMPFQASMSTQSSMAPQIQLPPQMPISYQSSWARNPWQAVGLSHYPPVEIDHQAQNVFYSHPVVMAQKQIQHAQRHKTKRINKRVEKLRSLGQELYPLEENLIPTRASASHNPECFTITNAATVRGITSRIRSQNDTNDFVTEMEHKMFYAQAQNLSLTYVRHILGSEHDSETMPFLAQHFMSPGDRNADINGRETAAKELHHRISEYHNGTHPYTSMKDVRDGLVRDLVVGWFSGQSKVGMLEPWKYGHAVVVFHLQSLSEGELKDLFESISLAIKDGENHGGPGLATVGLQA